MHHHHAPAIHNIIPINNNIREKKKTLTDCSRLQEFIRCWNAENLWKFHRPTIIAAPPYLQFKQGMERFLH